MISAKDALDYEVRSSWWASFVCWDWLASLAATYFVWKVGRKYGRYELSKTTAQRIESLRDRGAAP